MQNADKIHILDMAKKILIIIFVCVVSVTAVRMFLSVQKAQKHDEMFSPIAFDKKKEPLFSEKYESLKESYENRVLLPEKYSFSRNLFAPVSEEKEPEAPFIVRDIVYEPLFFTYMGHIEKGPMELIAQINSNKKTFFIKEGERMQGWTVWRITKERVFARNESGDETELFLRKQMFAKKPYASIELRDTQEIMEVSVGDSVRGDKILDITKEAVILKINSKTLTVYK